MKRNQPETKRTVTFGRVKPIPEDFGLGGLSDLYWFEKRQSLRREKAEKIRKGCSIAFALVVTYFAFFSEIDHQWSDLFSPIFLILFSTFFFYGVFPEKALIRFLAWKQSDREVAGNVASYELAKQEFDHFVLTAGLDFWRKLRGVDLEQEAAAVLREAGWTVLTTSIVGDGGVDLILRGSHTEIWCQCKGYVKPVSVAAIREIAGVCVASDAKPMLLVVNGITKPAKTEASKLGVMVLDAEELASLARGESDFSPSRNWG